MRKDLREMTATAAAAAGYALEWQLYVQYNNNDTKKK